MSWWQVSKQRQPFYTDSVWTGQATIWTTQVAISSVWRRWLSIRADILNDANIYYWPSWVTTSTWFVLYPWDTVDIDWFDWVVYVISSASSQKVYFTTLY
jgi:hypothetical protein